MQIIQFSLRERAGSSSSLKHPTFCRVTYRSYGLGDPHSREEIYGRLVRAHPYGWLQSKKAQI